VTCNSEKRVHLDALFLYLVLMLTLNAATQVGYCPAGTLSGTRCPAGNPRAWPSERSFVTKR
jgi:hypothetical protein